MVYCTIAGQAVNIAFAFTVPGVDTLTSLDRDRHGPIVARDVLFVECHVVLVRHGFAESSRCTGQN